MDQYLQNILSHEQRRQQYELEMIASENYVSPDVMAAYANVFTNKYAEGYPGARYYGWQEYVDELERLTQHRALRLFGLLARDTHKNWGGVAFDESTAVEDSETIIRELAGSTWAVNVQPLSWWPANVSVYIGLLQPGDTVLAMDLSAGGHLSHGHKRNVSSMYYRFVWYGVRPDTYEIDYEQVREKALVEKPAMIIAWFSAYVCDVDWGRFASIADEVEKVHWYRPVLMADIAHIAWLIVGDILQWPFEKFDVVTTTTHKTLRGPRGALIYVRKWLWIRKDWVEYDREKCINSGVFPGLQWWPHVHVIFAKAVAFFEALQPSFAQYAACVVKNAQSLASGLVDCGRHVLTGTTQNHIVLFDVTKRLVDGVWIETGLTWKIAERVLEDIGISVNKNMLPFDARSPMDPSWMRLWTPALTTRGMWIHEVTAIVEIMNKALQNHDDTSVIVACQQQVRLLCEKFPVA